LRCELPIEHRSYAKADDDGGGKGLAGGPAFRVSSSPGSSLYRIDPDRWARAERAVDPNPSKSIHSKGASLRAQLRCGQSYVTVVWKHERSGHCGAAPGWEAGANNESCYVVMTHTGRQVTNSPAIQLVRPS
jgi:hypothetical protein